MKYAVRVLGREKAFATFAILTLALGIGAVTTIFSIVDNVLLKPLAYKDPGRLYAASESVPSWLMSIRDLPVNAVAFPVMAGTVPIVRIRGFAEPRLVQLDGFEGEPEAVEGATCTWPVFQVLGVKPATRADVRGKRRSTRRKQVRRSQRLALAATARSGSRRNRQNDPDRWRAECRCRGVAVRFPLPVRRRARPLKSVSQACGDLQANGVRLGQR